MLFTLCWNLNLDKLHLFCVCLFLFVSGHGLVVETLLGRVEVKNSIFTNNFGNGVKAKFLDGLFPIVDKLLTFCMMASLDNQKFPQLIVGVPGPFQECTRVRLNRLPGALCHNLVLLSYVFSDYVEDW